MAAPPGTRLGIAARIDEGVAACERGLIVGLLGIMVSAVFLDALHRLFAAKEGRLEKILVGLLPAGAEEVTRAALAPGLLLLLTFGVVYGAVKARAPERSRVANAWRAGLFCLGLAAVPQILIRVLPNGLVWSQQMALCFLLWVALAGGSLAAREHGHIAFEMAGRIWPGPLQKPVERLARLVAAGFVVLLSILATLYAWDNYLEWRSSGGIAGRFEAFRIPRFVVFGFLPLPLAVTGLRFLAYGVRPDAEAAPGERTAG